MSSAPPLPLGLLLKTKREELEKSQKAFAKALGLHQPQLSRLENGAAGSWNIRATEVIMIATILAIPVDAVWASVYESYRQSIGTGTPGSATLSRNRIVVPMNMAEAELLPDGALSQGVGVVGADGVMRIVKRVAKPDEFMDPGHPSTVLKAGLDLDAKRPGEATFLFKGVSGIPIDVSDIPLADDDEVSPSP